MNQVHRHRGRLNRTVAKLAQGEVTVGFIGGSITDGRPRHNWPESVTAWLVESFPGVRFTIENAGIGATGSDLAVFRAKRDLIDRGCDLVFVEFAVNDNGQPKEKRARTREGLLRKLLAGEACDVVLVYTFMQDMYEDMNAGRTPASVAEFEELAEHYRIGSVWMGLYALEEVRRGRMRWDEWLPDGLHPTNRGSLSYGHSVIAFLERELSQASSGGEVCDIRKGDMLPAPLNADNWERTEILPLADIRREGPWVLQRWLHHGFMDQVLSTSAPGAKLEFTFHGRGIALGFDFGKRSSEFRYRIDAGEWQNSARDRPAWVGDSGWYRISVLPEQLPEGEHTFEFEVTHGNGAECKGTDCRLALVGIIR